MKRNSKGILAQEVWYQDRDNTNLWHGKHGVIINTAALTEREFYFDVIRVVVQPRYQKNYMARVYA